MTSLTWTPPNDKMCIALRHPDTKRWAICPSSLKHEDLHPWETQIEAKNETLVRTWNIASYVRRNYNWLLLQAEVTKYKKDGYEVIYGSMVDLHGSGTKWLRDNPKLWWQLTSASVEQLQVIKQIGETGSHMILESLWHQKTPLQNGPSIVMYRWTKLFPEEFRILDLVRQMSLTLKDAQFMVSQLHNKENPIDIIQESPSSLF